MNEAELIAKLVGEGSLSYGMIILIAGWLISRRITVEVAAASSMAREAIDAYTDRTNAIKSNAPRSIEIVGPVMVIHPTRQSGEFRSMPPRSADETKTWPDFNQG